MAEAQLLQRLQHPNIVTCHDVRFDSARRCVWLALEFMDGGDLGNKIKGRRMNGQSPFDGFFLQRVLSAVGSALNYIHSQGVLHRDVKPPNILADRKMKKVKLADFGISKILEASGHAGTVLGTPAYMSPELVSGKPYGSAADAWALGACLYELAALQRPFDASNQLALVWQIVQHEPPPLPPDTPADLSSIIRGLLHKDPLQRLRLEDLGLDAEHSQVHSDSSPGSAYAPPPCPSWSEWSGAFAVPETDPSRAKVQVASDEKVPTPPVAPLDPMACEQLGTEGSDLEEVVLEDTPISPTTPRTRTEGMGTAFAERSPATPRRNWLSRLGRGLRYGVLGGNGREHTEQALVSAFTEELTE
ncbi:unnamed protein product [Effrenium voratum]|uniref:non-specific serine/threonine protein kinase n=1 Tax=Effrenium voratum TaxID=2562239 RepID=A0AA36JIE4_9DINO|nr:unnamed protein product [Effrenium voratum]